MSGKLAQRAAAVRRNGLIFSTVRRKGLIFAVGRRNLPRMLKTCCKGGKLVENSALTQGAVIFSPQWRVGASFSRPRTCVSGSRVPQSDSTSRKS